jgi:hypothetical protein
MASGIYKITNIVNGKFYIGSTTRLSARKAEHKYRTKNHKGNSAIRSAVIKYGEENFAFDILEVFEFGEWTSREYKDEVLSSREQYYIDTLSPKYNIRKKDVTRSTGVCSIEQRAHLNRIAKLPRDTSSYKKPIIQTDKNGMFIKEFRCAQDAEKELGLYAGSISRVLSKEYKHTKNYYFKFKYINNESNL